MRALRHFVICSLLLSAVLVAESARAQVLPAGWRQKPTSPADPSRTFEVTGLAIGQFVTIRESPLLAIAGVSLQEWVNAVALAEAPPAGAWVASPGVGAQSATLATAVREYSSDSGVAFVVFAAVSGDGKLGRQLRVTFSSVALSRGPTGVAARQLMSDLATREIAASRSGVARVPSSAPWPPPASIGVVQGSAAPADTAKTVASGTTAVNTPSVAGRGVSDGQIEAVFYHWDQRYDAFQGLVMDEAVYVLLKDGTAYDRLPASLAAFDVTASRRDEPKRWGRWRRQGETYAFNWPVIGATFRSERGNVVRPSAPGASVNGHFVSGSTYTLPGGAVGMTFLSDVTLTADGRFTANGNRGTYRIEPYAIELRHADGRVERQSFLVDGDGIILSNGRMTRKK